MATKRPVSVQRIPDSGSNESNTTKAAATNADLPSNVNLPNVTPEPTNAAIEGGLDRPTTEETIAEQTSPEQDLGKSTIDVRDPEGQPTPDDKLPERPNFSLTDVANDAGTEPGPDTTLPTREELKEEFSNEVGMHPVGAGEEGPPTDPQEARDFFAEHGKGSMISDVTSVPGQYVIGTDSDGEVKNWSTMIDPKGKDGWAAEAADMKAYEKEMTQKADEAHAARLAREAKDNPPSTGGGTTPPETSGPNIVSTHEGEKATTYHFDDESTVMVWKDGAVTTIDKDGNMSTRPAPSTPSVKQPGSDDEYVVPEEVQEAIGGELDRLNELSGRELDPNSFGGASPNETQPTENDDDAFGAGDVKGDGGGAPESKVDRLLGGDDLFGDAAPGGASAGEVHNRNELAINYGPEHSDPQSSGREVNQFEQNTLEPQPDHDEPADPVDESGPSPFDPVVVDSQYDDVPAEVAYDPTS